MPRQHSRGPHECTTQKNHAWRDRCWEGGAAAVQHTSAAPTDQQLETAGADPPSTTTRRRARDLGIERVPARLVLRAARVAIVGMGPRGLTVLERLVANQRVHR